jgi:IS5 family transposase
VLKGDPSDADHVALSLKRHMKAFGHAPQLYGADRGFFSEQNLASGARSGVSMVCIPQRGGKKTPEREAFEKSAAFKKGQRFRAGIEGRISVPNLSRIGHWLETYQGLSRKVVTTFNLI